MKHNNLTKLFTAALAVLLLLPLFASCGDSDVPDGMKSVSPASSSFSLFVPTDWVDNSASGTASAVYSSTDLSNVSMTVMIMEPDRTTLPEYAEYADSSLKAALPGYALLVGSTAVNSGAIASSAESSENALPDGFSSCKMCGLNAISFEYTAHLDGTDYHFRQVVTIKGNYYYVFTYTSTAENYASHLEEVESILAEIRFK